MGKGVVWDIGSGLNIGRTSAGISPVNGHICGIGAAGRGTSVALHFVNNAGRVAYLVFGVETY